jgi:hypothetical protein
MKFIQFVVDKVSLSVIGVSCTQTKDSDENVLIPSGYVYSLLVCILSSEHYVSAIQYTVSTFLFVIGVYENSQYRGKLCHQLITRTFALGTGQIN